MPDAGIPLRLITPPVYRPAPDPWPEGLTEWCTRLYSPGDCWYASRRADGHWYQYPDHDGGRRVLIAPRHLGTTQAPMLVVLPSGDLFCLQSPTIRDGQPTLKGWTVHGQLPRVTVKPSINLVGIWHGWLRNGTLTTC